MPMTAQEQEAWYAIHSEYCHPALGLVCGRSGCREDLERRGWFKPTPEQELQDLRDALYWREMTAENLLKAWREAGSPRRAS